MPTSPMSHGEVKSVCDSLECSPSAHQPTSSIYNGGGTEPEAKKHTAKHTAAPSGHMTKTGSDFGKKGTSMPRNIAAGKAADSNKKV